MLILVGVTINVALNGGLFTQAEDATTGTEKQSIYEQIVSAMKIGDNGTIDVKGTYEAAKETLTAQGKTVTLKEPTDIEKITTTVIFTVTGKYGTYKYQITGTEIKLKETEEDVVSAELEKYIFGQDLKGRNCEEIIDDDMNFIDDEDSLIDASKEVKFLVQTGVLEDTKHTFIVYNYIKYKEDTYKFVCDNDFFSLPSYKITKINMSGARVGKTVKYGDEIWTILYDDDVNGLQMVCNENYEYNNDEFTLGYNDSLITNWDSLVEIADLDGNDELDKFEKTVYSYNNAIKTLNTACENLFKNDEGKYKNSDILDVRCVGSNPMKTEISNMYESNNLKEWPTNNPGMLNGKLESGDNYFYLDIEKMVALELIGIHHENSEEFWIASRYVDDVGHFRFGMLNWKSRITRLRFIHRFVFN